MSNYNIILKYGTSFLPFYYPQVAATRKKIKGIGNEADTSLKEYQGAKIVWQPRQCHHGMQQPVPFYA